MLSPCNCARVFSGKLCFLGCFGVTVLMFAGAVALESAVVVHWERNGGVYKVWKVRLSSENRSELCIIVKLQDTRVKVLLDYVLL
jgi:hypothetical protein